MKSIWRSIPPTRVVERTSNPIRKLVDANISRREHMIDLSLGDPTAYGNFHPPPHVTERLVDAVRSGKLNGYPNCCGYPEARYSVARKFGPPNRKGLEMEDVVLTSGCSQALEMTMTAMLNPGSDELLLPQPGFPLYHSLAQSKGIQTMEYPLDPEKEWAVDLSALRKILAMNPNIRAMVVNNPSNPCGSVFSESHMLEILKVAEEYKIAIISDEVYSDMVFPGEHYVSFASLSDTVPIVEVGGLAKRYMMPGWRLGWTIVHDRGGVLENVKMGLTNLAQLTLGPNSLIQGILGHILFDTPDDYQSDIMRQIKEQTEVLRGQLEGVPGLSLITPRSTIFAMVGIDSTLFGVDDVTFSKDLLISGGVSVLPGQVFGVPNFIRVVTSAPQEKLQEAGARIAKFASEYRR